MEHAKYHIFEPYADAIGLKAPVVEEKKESEVKAPVVEEKKESEVKGLDV